MADIGLLTLRLVVGLYLFGHGAQKLFGWFGGPGLRGHAQNMTTLGFRPAALWAAASTAGEIGGLLLALGFLSPLGSLGVAASMLVAIIAVHWPKGPWAAKGGYELPLTNLAAAVALGLTGPGGYSLDALLGTHLPPVAAEVLAVLTALAVVAALLSRKPSASPDPGRASKSA